MISAKQGLHLPVHLLWGCRFLSSNLIGQPLVVANDEPFLPTVRSPRLKERMKLFDEVFCYFLLRMVNDIVNAAEMVDRLYNIIHVDGIVRNADGVCFKDIARLLVG